MTRRWATGLLAGGSLLVGAVAGWLRPIPEIPDSADSAGTAWALPVAAGIERTSALLFQTALGLRWEADAPLASANEEAASVQWTLRGVLLPEGEILVQIGSDPAIKRFGASDILPDGARVVAVERNGVLLDRDGCQEQRPLYPPSENVQEPGCTAPGVREEVSPQ